MQPISGMPLYRYGISAFAALLVTLLLLLLMQSLISTATVGVQKAQPLIYVPLVTIRKQVTPPPPPPPRARPDDRAPPPLPAPGDRATPIADGGTIPVTVPGVDRGNPRDWVQAALPDRDPLPLFKPRPVYPPGALRRGIQGHVIVEYTVTAAGRTANIRVVDSQPAGVFDRAARRAAAKFRYQPAVRDGRAVATDSVRNLFTFRLEE